MGFDCCIGRIKRDRLTNPQMTDKEFADQFDEIYGEIGIDWEKDYIDDWCSSGQYWFNDLSDYVDPMANDYGSFYVINRDDYRNLVTFAKELMKKIELVGMNITTSITYMPEEEDGKEAPMLCRRIDGINVVDDENMGHQFWAVDDDYSFMSTKKYINPDEVNSYQRFIAAVLELGTTDWDNEIVWISGGW